MKTYGNGHIKNKDNGKMARFPVRGTGTQRAWKAAAGQEDHKAAAAALKAAALHENLRQRKVAGRAFRGLREIPPCCCDSMPPAHTANMSSKSARMESEAAVTEATANGKMPSFPVRGTGTQRAWKAAAG
jgi:hypothetical protein